MAGKRRDLRDLDRRSGTGCARTRGDRREARQACNGSSTRRETISTDSQPAAAAASRASSRGRSAYNARKSPIFTPRAPPRPRRGNASRSSGRARESQRGCAGCRPPSIPAGRPLREPGAVPREPRVGRLPAAPAEAPAGHAPGGGRTDTVPRRASSTPPDQVARPRVPRSSQSPFHDVCESGSAHVPSYEADVPSARVRSAATVGSCLNGASGTRQLRASTSTTSTPVIMRSMST